MPLNRRRQSVPREVSYRLAIAHGKWAARRFRRACDQTPQVQRRLLGRILGRNAGCAFGRDLGFAGLRDDPDAYRNAVPVQDYEGHRPYVERMLHGEKDVLFHRREKLLIFARTSGTTAAPKDIPITRRWLNGYRRGALVWGVLAACSHPTMFNGKILTIASALHEGKTPCGVPYGSASGLGAASQKKVAQTFYALPAAVFEEVDYEARYRLMARLTVGQPVSCVVTPNPSTVLRLVRLIDAESESLIADVRDGTFRSVEGASPTVLEAVGGRVRPDPARSRELERAREEGGGHLLPRHYWPGIAFIGNWTGGPVANYLEEYPQWFGEVPVRDLGLMASEARMTIPFEDGTASGVLDVQHSFFEFLPVEDEDRPGAATRLAHEVEVGQEYLILLTTVAGLYRYDIADVVRVTGWYGRAPVVEFRHKGRHITSMTGEKVSESQVVAALREAAARLGETPGPFVAFPERAGPVPRYVLWLEVSAVGSGGVERWGGEFDRALKGQNIEYESKRSSGRLEEVHVETVPDGTFEAMVAARVAAGARAEQLKHVHLQRQRPDLGRPA